MFSFKEHSPQGKGQGRVFINLSSSFPRAGKELFHHAKIWQNCGFVMQNPVHSAKIISHLQNILKHLDNASFHETLSSVRWNAVLAIAGVIRETLFKC